MTMTITSVAALLLSFFLLSSQASKSPSARHQHPSRRDVTINDNLTIATCTATSSQPNPIAQEYAQDVTGTLNATLAIVPIPLSTARELVPSQWTILEDAYRALLPAFPEGMYPVLMQAGLDHDIQLAAYDISVADFQRIGWSFPFIDLLGDGFSSFTWAPAQLISAANEIAITGSQAYGTFVAPAVFDQSCDAYSQSADGSVHFAARATTTVETLISDTVANQNSSLYATINFSPLSSTGADAQTNMNPYPIDFYKNVTNQPIFANGSQCDSQVRLFNSTINQGAYAPVPVKGAIYSNLQPLNQSIIDAAEREYGIFGILVDTPFIEYNLLDCQSLAGSSGTGSGD
ncbi:hypothetical protein BD289DRAFT_482497 [Coniella lustricola]|uniref:Uncharacterized protein n=1 Tax=Coniella lustricola TaxID=2025994 RepID=A0A2T3A8M7_9PEZI|nr:hypothetical protein BD289DRAFT_482497 [Coniella lustricola]